MALRSYFAMVRNQSPMVDQGLASKDWYVFFYNLYNAAIKGLPQAELGITAGASPFDYQAVIRGQLLVSGGTVSAIEFSRNGSTFYSIGATNGFVQMDEGDTVRVTYTVAPALTFFPM